MRDIFKVIVLGAYINISWVYDIALSDSKDFSSQIDKVDIFGIILQPNAVLRIAGNIINFEGFTHLDLFFRKLHFDVPES